MEIIEIWKNVIGFEGSYQVSNLGRVKSLARVDRSGHKLQERILKNTIDSYGYLVVGLFKNSVNHTHKVHRIVATIFIPNPENKPQVNHINGNKLNNIVDNLEWATHQENKTHSCITGLAARGSRVHLAKLTESDIPEIRTRLLAGELNGDIAKDYGVTWSTIDCIKKRVTWKHV
jgi:hypothetical protein